MKIECEIWMRVRAESVEAVLLLEPDTPQAPLAVVDVGLEVHVAG